MIVTAPLKIMSSTSSHPCHKKKIDVCVMAATEDNNEKRKKCQHTGAVPLRVKLKVRRKKKTRAKTAKEKAPHTVRAKDKSSSCHFYSLSGSVSLPPKGAHTRAAFPLLLQTPPSWTALFSLSLLYGGPSFSVLLWTLLSTFSLSPWKPRYVFQSRTETE
jgi:hypothetical protein